MGVWDSRKRISLTVKRKITQILRNTSHNRYVSRNRIRVNNEDINLENRVKYLRNIYDDKKFDSMVYKNNNFSYDFTRFFFNEYHRSDTIHIK